jgi:hypothetical protein
MHYLYAGSAYKLSCSDRSRDQDQQIEICRFTHQKEKKKDGARDEKYEEL